ncbi:hypothetical protein C8R44DRAFT_383193 [Mycena epipterygia]|nr:hypothetical protein C8R44DRAFT_383193 [Mycena epipterygia]
MQIGEQRRIHEMLDSPSAAHANAIPALTTRPQGILVTRRQKICPRRRASARRLCALDEGRGRGYGLHAIVSGVRDPVHARGDAGVIGGGDHAGRERGDFQGDESGEGGGDDSARRLLDVNMHPSPVQEHHHRAAEIPENASYAQSASSSSGSMPYSHYPHRPPSPPIRRHTSTSTAGRILLLLRTAVHRLLPSTINARARPPRRG